MYHSGTSASQIKEWRKVVNDLPYRTSSRQSLEANRIQILDIEREHQQGDKKIRIDDVREAIATYRP